MNKLIAIVIVFGLVLSASVRADGGQCNNACSSEHGQCMDRLGSAATGNCGDGFRLCVQRCNPQRMNTAFLESHSTQRLLARSQPAATANRCDSRCALSAQLCAESGNSGAICRNAQQNCEARCGSDS